MKGNLTVIFIISVVLIIIIACIKIGRERTLSWAMKILSPICIILFYLSGVSIIVPVLEKFQVTNHLILSSDSIRVAVDSAIVTLFVNIILSILSFPIKVEVETRNRQDLEQVIIYCDRSSKIEYMVKISSKYKRILKWYKKYKNPVLRINNSFNTSIVIDREEEYGNMIDSSNASKYIDINLSCFPESDKIYFDLNILSNKTIKWDDVIETEFYLNGNRNLNIHTLFWQVKRNVIKIVHREESI